MAVTTNFFAANQADVKRLLPGWQLPPPPLSEPMVAQWKGSASAEPFMVRSRRDSEHLPTPNYNAIALPDISSLPYVQAKKLDVEDIALLFSMLARLRLDEASDLVHCGYLIGPPDPEVAAQRLPSAFTEALASASYDALAHVAQSLQDCTVTIQIVSAGRCMLDTMVTLVQLRALAAWSRSAGSDLFALTSAVADEIKS